MKTYVLTVYEKNGENLLDETFEAADDEKAKEIGEKNIDGKGISRSHLPLCLTRC